MDKSGLYEYDETKEGNNFIKVRVEYCEQEEAMKRKTRRL